MEVLGLTKHFRSYTQSWTVAQSSLIKNNNNKYKNNNDNKVHHVCIYMNQSFKEDLLVLFALHSTTSQS